MIPILRPNRPLPPAVKHKRYARPMTIAIGFVIKQGVLLCADSRIESEYSKDFGLKIIPISGTWGTGFAAYAGHVDIAVSAVQKFDRKLKTVSAPAFLDKFEEELEEHWNHKIYCHPLFDEDRAPMYSLLLAVRTTGNKVRLYVTSETSVREVTAFRCIGSGEDLATHFLDATFIGGLGEYKAVCLASSVLSRVKRSVSGCDGLSVFRVLRDDGNEEGYIGDPLPKFVESISAEMDMRVSQLLLSICCDEEPNFGCNRDVFTKLVDKYRQNWQEARALGIPARLDEFPREQ